MRLRLVAYGLVGLLFELVAVARLTTAATSSGNFSNATHLPLFPTIEGEPELPTLHLSLSSLLPILPHLAPGPEHTLAVTLATTAFKPLLYNWLCFLRYKAKWGQTPEFDMHGERNTAEDPYPDTPKLLVVTSDEDLALELSDLGVVTWLILGIDWEEWDEIDRMADDEPTKAEAIDNLQRAMADDLFTNLRLLDLIIPSVAPIEPEDIHKVVPWGTLRYQSLMLERTAVMSALVGALVESQRSEAAARKAEDADWRERALKHDWESGMLHREPFQGVKGVLMVDNDAVW